MGQNNRTRVSAISDIRVSFKMIGLKPSSLQWWFIRKYTLSQSLYCEYEGIFVFKYPSLITWFSLIDRNNTLLGSILYVENYLLEVRASSNQPSEIGIVCCQHALIFSLFCAIASPRLCPLPSSSFIKYLNPG